MTVDSMDAQAAAAQEHLDPAAAPPLAGRGDAPLLYIDGATEGTLQWKAETFQLVNWGGFEGRNAFTFHRGATLISGASGTGKSSLLDAYIALMMPSDTPFNGASNDAVGGRARSADQRNLLSYLRGQTDTVADSTGREKAKVLRGERTASWGAVGMTFVDDHRRRFTAFRVYYVPARASRSNEITMRMATYDGALNLADLAGTVDQTFAPKALKSAFPGLRTHDSYAAFAQTLHTRLGIGANGDGSKALRLLVRIQSGHQIRTVDELYKEMVLERPATFDAADRAIDHFDDLEAAYLAMQTEEQKAELLTPITAKHEALVQARTELDTLDTFGITHTGDTPITLWSLRTEARLIDAATTRNGEARTRTSDLLRHAKAAELELDRQLETAKEEHRNSGGAKLESLARDIEDAQSRRDVRLERRSALMGKTLALGVPLATAEEFAAVQSAAATFLAEHPGRVKELTERRDDLMRRAYPLHEQGRTLREERQSLAGRTGRVPKFLDDLRRAAAEAAGMDPADLPFVAELVDVAADQARWRTAIETVLVGSARIMLVPAEKFEALSRAIDPLRLRGRLTFEGVPHAAHQDHSGDPDRIAGKLVYRDSTFSHWVHRHVSAPSRNALCVEMATDLRGDDVRVTLAGQTRQRTRGSHGRSEQANIIGFSSADVIADIDTQLDRLGGELDRLAKQLRQVEDDAGDLDRTRRAYEAILDVAWGDIDVDTIEADIAAREAERLRILEADDTLKALQAHIDHLGRKLEDARDERFKLDHRNRELNAEHADLATRQDAVNDDLYRIEDDGRIALDDAQATRLDEEFVLAVRPADPTDHELFGQNLARLRDRLLKAGDNARERATKVADDLATIFGMYQLKWEDPNLGRTAESYPDYARILENIVTTGLHRRRAEWRQRLTQWSGQDLVPLSGAMESSIEEIEDRLEPINDILRHLPFGANRDRLQIKLRRLAPENVTQFRKDLRVLSSTATKELPEQQLEARFKDLQRFMAQIRRRDDPRANSDLTDRERLLDVRRHVEITAERRSPADDTLLSTHSALGGKSGGESQELVAFIVGAALRFRLGDELRARPRFAPVFLDEGFVKSDAEFAGRAVQAWKGLGFQLIVGAPLDKVTALEPHMDELLAITKNTTTGFAYVHPLKDAAAIAAQAEAADR